MPPVIKGGLKIVLFVVCLSNQGSIAWIFFFLSLEEILLGLITWYLISSFFFLRKLARWASGIRVLLQDNFIHLQVSGNSKVFGL